ncbi:hypothetical protein BV898_18735 [Hypsibius exemplaris]|uniref:G-protein coupled receptors family 1 profile domain-containing protein n=1 Tax=Hypsibius exemplaris TaxID=2072580 RepID=A0A9X6NHU2_HYPEX|nr:hypothetical protein BV898_18735 [Hypsibius exemplaris]
MELNVTSNLTSSKGTINATVKSHELLWWTASILGLNFAGALANILLLLVMTVYKPLRQSSSCALLVHCIVIDLYQTVVAVPAQIIPVYMGPTHSLPTFYCRTLPLLVFSTSWASMHASCALAMHRLVATVLPHRYAAFTKRSSLALMILVPWVLSLCIAMFPTVEYGMKVVVSPVNGGCTTVAVGTQTVFTMYTVIGTYLPTVVIGLCYMGILLKSLMEMHDSSRSTSQATALRRRSEISLTLFVSFLWHCITLYPMMIAVTFYPGVYSRNVQLQLALKGMINVFSAVNPVFYWTSSRLFQNGLKEVLGCRWTWAQARSRISPVSK